MATRSTRQQRLVLAAVRARGDHPSADDIYLAVRGQDPHISRGTVYRNLGALAAAGQVLQVRGPAADRFDLRTEQHYHILCSGCGAVCDVPLPYRPDWDARVQAATGFAVQGHRTLFEGLCPACQARAAAAKKDG